MSAPGPSTVPARVLVTGGSGFIGTNLVEHFLRAGSRVASFDSSPPRNREHRPLWRAGDLRDPAALRAALDDLRPELVLHLAARTDLAGRTLADYSANTEGLQRLLEALDRSAGVRRVLFFSSMLVCRLGYQPAGDRDYCPDSVYGESKVAGEELVRQSAGGSYAWSILRPTSIWGPWFSVPYRDFFDAVRAGLYVHPRRRPVRRSYGFVLNAVQQIATIASADAATVGGRLYYIADYEPIDVHAWADLISRAFGRRPVRQVPLPLLRAAAQAGDLLERMGMARPPLTGRRLRNLLTEAVYDLSATRALCPDLPYGLERGVATTVEWMARQPAG